MLGRLGDTAVIPAIEAFYARHDHELPDSDGTAYAAIVLALTGQPLTVTAALARLQHPGGAIPAALAGELLTLLRAARLREGQHARIIPLHGDNHAPPGGRPAIITTITRHRLRAAANFGDHGWHMLTRLAPGPAAATVRRGS